MITGITIECNRCGENRTYNVSDTDAAIQEFKENDGVITEDGSHLCLHCYRCLTENYFVIKIDDGRDKNTIGIVYDPNGLRRVGSFVDPSTKVERIEVHRIEKAFFESLEAMGIPRLEFTKVRYYHPQGQKAYSIPLDREREVMGLDSDYYDYVALDIRKALEMLEGGKMPKVDERRRHA